MTSMSDFIEDPDKLLSLIREVINKLVEKDKQQEIVSMEAQLREISKAIENLERRSIHVPDSLRSEKTRLVAAMAIQSDTSQALKHLTEGFEDILNGLKLCIGETNEVNKKKRTGGKRSTTPKTSGKILRSLIIEALKKFGGSAHKRDIHYYIKEKLDGQLLPGDMEWRESTRNHAWENNTDWERFSMVKDGILKEGSPKGIWELREEIL